MPGKRTGFGFFCNLRWYVAPKPLLPRGGCQSGEHRVRAALTLGLAGKCPCAWTSLLPSACALRTQVSPLQGVGVPLSPREQTEPKWGHGLRPALPEGQISFRRPGNSEGFAVQAAPAALAPATREVLKENWTTGWEREAGDGFYVLFCKLLPVNYFLPQGAGQASPISTGRGPRQATTSKGHPSAHSFTHPTH